MKKICFAYDMLFAEKANLKVIEKILLDFWKKRWWRAGSMAAILRLMIRLWKQY